MSLAVFFDSYKVAITVFSTMIGIATAVSTYSVGRALDRADINELKIRVQRNENVIYSTRDEVGELKSHYLSNSQKFKYIDDKVNKQQTAIDRLESQHFGKTVIF